MVDRMEQIVERVDTLVGVAETVIAPVTATESAVRRMLGTVRRTARI